MKTLWPIKADVVKGHLIHDQLNCDIKSLTAYLSDEYNIAEIRSDVHNSAHIIRNLSVNLISAINIRYLITKGQNFPGFKVGIAKNFDGEEYFVFKYNGKDIFGETV